jgi:hypothetical protein
LEGRYYLVKEVAKVSYQEVKKEEVDGRVNVQYHILDSFEHSPYPGPKLVGIRHNHDDGH